MLLWTFADKGGWNAFSSFADTMFWVGVAVRMLETWRKIDSQSERQRAYYALRRESWTEIWILTLSGQKFEGFLNVKTFSIKCRDPPNWDQIRNGIYWRFLTTKLSLFQILHRKLIEKCIKIYLRINFHKAPCLIKENPHLKHTPNTHTNDCLIFHENIRSFNIQRNLESHFSSEFTKIYLAIIFDDFSTIIKHEKLLK